MADRDSFIFYRSFRETAQGLEGEERLHFYEAIMDFAFTGQEPEFEDKVSKALFAGIRPNIAKGWVSFNNGLKGGAPKGNNNRKSTQNQPNINLDSTQNQPNARVNNSQVSIVKNNSQEQEENSSLRSSFHAPTQEEVISFFRNELNSTQSLAEDYYDYYTSCGWVVGGNKKMKDWKSAARRWVRNQNGYTPRKSYQKGPDVEISKSFDPTGDAFSM